MRRGALSRGDAPERRPPSSDDSAVILALVGDRTTRARLAGAAREFGGVRFFPDGPTLRTALRGRDAAAVIVDAVDPTGAPAWPLVAALRADFPRVPVIAYCD